MTDTNSGITSEEAKEMGIFSLPMPVIIDDNVFFEGTDINQKEYFEALTSGKDVKTSQPSPGDVLDMWDAIFEEGYDEIVYIPMSSGLSASCHASTMLSEEYDGKVQVADNHRISVTMRTSIIDAMKMAEKGMSAKEIKDRLEANAFNASIYLAVDTLEYLKKGGRVTAAAATVGTVLNIKPVLTIQGEKLDAFAKIRGMKKAQSKMLDALENDINERFKDYDKSRMMIGVAAFVEDASEAKEWKKAVEERFSDVKDIYYDDLSFSVGCHVGPGTLGVAVSIMDE